MLSLSVSLISLVSLCLSACLSVCSLWDAVACAFVGEIEGTRGEGGRGGGGHFSCPYRFRMSWDESDAGAFQPVDVPQCAWAGSCNTLHNERWSTLKNKHVVSLLC